MPQQNTERDDSSERSGRGPDQIPPGKPRFANANRFNQRLLVGFGLLGQEDDVAAVRARSQMRERLLVLVQRQSVLGEGRELLGVRMLRHGLEEIVHRALLA
jgi:hypothetical protein